MQIQVHTDNNIEGRGELTAYVEREVEAVLSRFSDRVTRIEVHLSDESAGRSTGADIRCLIEARPTGRAPVTVTDDADTLDRALSGAIHRLSRRLDNEEGQLDDHGGRASIRGRAEDRP
jgi:ribosome-associated translation inhibitor RaiA